MLFRDGGFSAIATTAQNLSMNAARIKKLRRKIRFRRAIRRWRYLLILLLLVLLVGAVYSTHWAYGKILNRQAFALVGRAMEDLREGKIQQARMGAETAQRIKPGHPAATRLLARIQVAGGEPEAALATFQKLTDERQLTLDDIRLYARLAAMKGENQLAQRLATAVAASGDLSFPHLLQATTLLRDRKPAEAETELRAAVQVDFTNTSKVALLDFLLANSRRGESNQEIAIMIQEFSGRNDALGANALALGLQTGLMNPEKRGEWIEKLRAHPQADAGHRLIADSAALATNPDAKSEIAAALAKDFQSRPLADRVAAAKWMVAQREHSPALSILPLDEAITQPVSFVYWLDACALAGDWPASLAALDRKENPLPAQTCDLFRGLGLKKLGKTAEAAACFQAAIAGAGDDPAKFAFTTIYLLGAEETALFESNLAMVSSRPALALALWRNLYPALATGGGGDAEFSLRVLEVLAASPELSVRPEFQNELAYHQILLGKPAALATLERQINENPADLASRATLAFHHLKTGNTKAAMALFDNFSPDVDARSLPPRLVLVFSATLAANEKKDTARQIASRIPSLSVSRQEAAFFHDRLKPD